MKIMVPLMRVAFAAVCAVFVITACRESVAQPTQATPAPAAAQTAATLPAVAPVSTQLQPALNAVHQTVDLARVDKWKKGNIRDEAAANISQIQRDIDVTLPPMLRDSDTTPASLTKLLPISRNVSALYDVLLRVVEASRVIASDDQVEQLQKALVTLGNARLALSDRMQTMAAAMEKQVADLRANAQQQAALRPIITVPVVLPCMPPTTHRTKTTQKKPASSTTNTTKPSTTGGNQNQSNH